MKKAILTIVLTLLALSLIACGGKTAQNDSDQKVSPMGTINQDNPQALKKAEECLLGLLNSQTSDEINNYVTENSESYSENLLRNFPGTDYTVALQLLGSHEGYDFYTYTIKRASDSTVNATGIEVFTDSDKGYVVETNQTALNKLVQDCTCHTCTGTGTISMGGNVCGICGGTGQQYYPAVYYDAALNMWQGQFQACSGCGGTGKTGNTISICPSCSGNRMIFK